MSGPYVLGTEEAERERLRLQHELWLPAARAAWHRGGLAPGSRVLDLGAGPGFCALELARAVGPGGHVLALEGSEAYAAAASEAAREQGLSWLEVRRCDLADPAARLVEPGSVDLAWCRWLAMFLPRLEPLADLLAAALRPGGVLVAQEYVHWGTFGLHPGGDAVARFGAAVVASFRAAGGDPDPARRLPGLLAARDFAIEDLRLLPVVGRGGDGWARWLERFVAVYGEALIQRNPPLWSREDAIEAAREIAAARTEPGSFWLGPMLLEVRARWNRGS